MLNAELGLALGTSKTTTGPFGENREEPSRHRFARKSPCRLECPSRTRTCNRAAPYHVLRCSEVGCFPANPSHWPSPGERPMLRGSGLSMAWHPSASTPMFVPRRACTVQPQQAITMGSASRLESSSHLPPQTPSSSFRQLPLPRQWPDQGAIPQLPRPSN